MAEIVLTPGQRAAVESRGCALLVAANAATKDKIVQAQEDKFSKSISDTFGKADYTTVDLSIDGIDSVTKDENGRIIFEITADGYAKGGLHLLIGFDNQGAVEGISFLSIDETPGLGTKVQDDKSFTEQFKGVSSADYDFSVITGATYSSNGMKSAVDQALKAYNEHKEEILNG